MQAPWGAYTYAASVLEAVRDALEGWMSEWLKVPVLKTGAFNECRGFESLSIRVWCVLQLFQPYSDFPNEAYADGQPTYKVARSLPLARNPCVSTQSFAYVFL